MSMIFEMKKASPAAMMPQAAAGSDVQRLWDAVVEHGASAASLVSPELTATIDALVAVTSLISLAVSFAYAIWAMVRYLRNTQK